MDCIAIDRNKGVFADGIFMNDSFEEDTAEIFSVYFPDNNGFVVDDVIEQIDKIADFVKRIKKGNYVSGHLKSEDILSDLFSYEDVPPFLIKIITTADVSAKQKYAIQKQVEGLALSIPGLKIDATIAFGEDIEAMIESNTAPFDCVKKDSLMVDTAVNEMHYGPNSFVCNVSAQSLKKLWAKEGHRGLLAMNLRYYIKSQTIDDRIEETILLRPDEFWYLNNGIIVVCDDFKFKGNELILTNFSIVNGGQTTRMIGTIPFDHDFYICCKIIKNTFEDVSSKNRFVSAVAEASNTQKPIKAKDIIANRPEQRDLKSMMAENKVFIEIKRGEKPDKNVYKEPWQKTKNNELAQSLYSFIFQEPGPARNSVSTVLQNPEKYRTLFVRHNYDFKFLKGLLFLQKAYEAFNRKVGNGNADATMKSLVKNGMHYCLATIGYLLKLKYSPAYLDKVRKSRANASLFNSVAAEQAFNHAFVKFEGDYNAFVKAAIPLFEAIFNSIILYQFTMEKNVKETLSAANWTKQNTGFYNIRNYINSQLFDMHGNLLSILDACFIDLPEEQLKENDALYEKNCASNKKIKNSMGFEITEDDGKLRDELMIFRMNKAAEKGWKESVIFTDKKLDRLVAEKPTSIDELKLIVPVNTWHTLGLEIIAIIQKYI